MFVFFPPFLDKVELKNVPELPGKAQKTRWLHIEKHFVDGGSLGLVAHPAWQLCSLRLRLLTYFYNYKYNQAVSFAYCVCSSKGQEVNLERMVHIWEVLLFPWS